MLQDTDRKFGVVQTIAGYVHGDILIEGRADHAGATPMDMRCDSAVVGGQDDRRARATCPRGRSATVGTVGEIEVEPGLINAIPGRTRISLDVRGPDDGLVHGVVRTSPRSRRRPRPTAG